MKIIFIRHGSTPGNLEKRYVGRTDESILDTELKYLETVAGRIAEKGLVHIDKLYVSPMKRCIETADIIFKGTEKISIEGFKECDFGQFEYKNYQELSDKPEYQRYIDSNGESPFPDGESKKDFTVRCVQAFDDIMDQLACEEDEVIAIVAHAGTIMAIMDVYSFPHKDYFEWNIKNGEAMIVDLKAVCNEDDAKIKWQLSVLDKLSRDF